MKNMFWALSLLLIAHAACCQKYPVTKTSPQTVTKFNTSFSDDYTWLENMKAEEVKNWANAQNETTNLHFQDVKKEYDIVKKIKDYNAYSSSSLPAKKEAFYYTKYIVDKGKPSVLYYRKELNGQAIEAFNPFKIYKSETATLMGYNPSKNSKYLACEVSTDGSDRHEIRFVELNKNKTIDDKIDQVKFSKMAWNEDAGIFYKRNTNLNTFAKDSTYQLFYHKLGTAQERDQLIFDTSKSGNSFSYFTKKDKLFIIEENDKSVKKNYYCASLNEEPFTLQKFIDLDDAKCNFLFYHNNLVYFSSKEYDWGDIRTSNLLTKEEKVIIPQIYNNLLVDTYFTEGYIFCKYKNLGKFYVIAYDENGTFIRKIDAPESTTFDMKFFDPNSKSLYITVYSYTLPSQNFKLNIETGAVNNFYNDYIIPKGTLFPLDHFVTKNLTVKSRDNKLIPITVIYKKGTPLDGNNPTLLEAYGGFGLISEPDYDPALLYFLEKGGVYCFAEIRGGGEKGPKWHQDGMGAKK